MRRAPWVAAVLAGFAAALPATLIAGCAGPAAEGRPWVKGVRFDGAQHIDRSELADRLAAAATPWYPFARRRYLEAATLPADKKRIEAFYRANGFFHARVTAVKLVPRGEDAVEVVFTVEEGPPAKLRAVRIRGVETLPAEERRKLEVQLPLTSGREFVHEKYLQTRDLLAARLRSLGYAWATVRGEALVDRDHDTVDVELSAVPGPRVRFGEVQVLGDASVDPRAVARRVPIRSGERFDPDRIELARGRLYNLGLFSSVRIDPVPNPSRSDVADVRVILSPGQKRELRIGAGLGIEPQRYDVHFSVQYVRRNFLGGLRTLRLREVPAWVWIPVSGGGRSGPASLTEAQLTQPDFLRRDLDAKALVGYDLGVDYAFKYRGPRLAVGLDQALFRDRLHLALSYNFQFLQFSNTAPAFLTDPTLSRRFFGYTNPYRIAYLLGQVSLDLRDRPLQPHFGTYLSVSVEEGAAALGGAFRYTGVVPDARLYFPLGSRVTLALRLQYGRIFTPGSDPTPITRRLYLGGPDSHRGFGYDRLAPQVPSGSSLAAIPIGGTRLLLGQVELRVDVARIFGNWAGVVAFLDAGDVPQAGTSLSLRALHHAAGAGLRYRTVIGTIRVDLGIRLDRVGTPTTDGRQNPDPGSRLAFHLSLGEAF